jgi:hypothetical protein
MNKFTKLKERLVELVLAAKINAQTPTNNTGNPSPQEPEK